MLQKWWFAQKPSSKLRFFKISKYIP